MNGIGGPSPLDCACCKLLDEHAEENETLRDEATQAAERIALLEALLGRWLELRGRPYINGGLDLEQETEAALGKDGG